MNVAWWWWLVEEMRKNQKMQGRKRRIAGRSNGKILQKRVRLIHWI